MSLTDAPADYPRIRYVSSFEELVAARFENGINALCWRRTLPGDFAEVIAQLPVREGIVTLEDEDLESLVVSEAGRAAIDVMLGDLLRLRELELEPLLDHINGFLRDAVPGPVRTDVGSFHADSATAEADTWLCTYIGPCSEGLRNEEALRRVDVPETRAALLEIYGGSDDAGFIEYLHENCFDLHYVPVSGAKPFPFGTGNLWRIATEHPGCPVPPCIHRAPDTRPGDPPRLLLIS